MNGKLLRYCLCNGYGFGLVDGKGVIVLGSELDPNLRRRIKDDIKKSLKAQPDQKVVFDIPITIEGMQDAGKGPLPMATKVTLLGYPNS